MRLYDYETQLKRPFAEKIAELNQETRLRHVILAEQFEITHLENLRRNADMIRRLSKIRSGAEALAELLRTKRAMLYFTQPSTRTFLSFMSACQILGIRSSEVRDPRISSSFAKRESEFDAIRMFSSYFDVIIMRTNSAALAESCAYLMNDLEQLGQRSVPVVNAGSASDEHPTQALLDIYTLQRTFDFDQERGDGARLFRLREKYTGLEMGIAGKTYAFCGDMGRGRTVRSLARVLTKYDGVKMYFISPSHPSLRLGDDIKQYLESKGVHFQELDSLDTIVGDKPMLASIDCLYMTRIQHEHDTQDESARFDKLDLRPYRLTPDRVSRMREYAPILHPFPRDRIDQEIPTSIDTDKRAVYFRQARNGMWTRAALLVHLFGAESRLAAVFDSFFRG
jgi:aspartate carbamoyltransferase catalytic subunit